MPKSKPVTLGKKVINGIVNTVDNIFNVIKTRFLGKDYTKQGNLTVVIDPSPWRHTLPGMYASAAAEEGTGPDKEILSHLVTVAESYIESQREKTKAKVLQGVTNAINNDGDLDELLTSELQEIWETSTTELTRIAESELNTAKNMGSLEGIVKVNAALGVEDPTVAFLGPNDNLTCKECKKTFWLPDGITPKVFKLSEVQSGYYVRGTYLPHIPGCHPACRHSIVNIMNGYGFKNGSIAFIALDHDEFKRQRAENYQ